MKQEHLIITKDANNALWVAGKPVNPNVTWEQLLSSVPLNLINTVQVRDETSSQQWESRTPHETENLQDLINYQPPQPYINEHGPQARKLELVLLTPEVSQAINWGQKEHTFTLKKREEETKGTTTPTVVVPKIIHRNNKTHIEQKKKEETKKKGPTLKPVEGAEQLDWETNGTQRQLSLGANEKQLFKPFQEHTDTIQYPEGIVDASQVYLPGERKETRSRKKEEATLTIDKPKKATSKIFAVGAGVILLAVLGGRATSLLTAPTYFEACVDSRTLQVKNVDSCQNNEGHASSVWVPEASMGDLKEGAVAPDGVLKEKPQGEARLKTFEDQKKEREAEGA